MRLIGWCFLPILFTLPAYAGTEVGNGGQGVVCRNENGKIRSARLFDFQEAEELRYVKISLGDHSLPVDAKIALMLDRVQKISPLRAQLYSGFVSEFANERKFVDSPLSDTQDADSIIVPGEHGCHIEQAAIQRKKKFPEDKFYFINREIWDALDNDSKAGLILHEIIYREASGFGQKTSEYVRYFNSRIAGDTLGEIRTDEQIYRFFLTLKFPWVEIAGLRLRILECPSSPDLLSICAANQEPSPILVMFHNDGRIKYGKFLVSANGQGTAMGGSQVYWIGSHDNRNLLSVVFFPSGRVQRVFADDDGHDTFSVLVDGQWIYVDQKLAAQMTGVLFHDSPENGPSCLRVGAHETFKMRMADQTWRTFGANELIALDERGFVTSWQPKSSDATACGKF